MIFGLTTYTFIHVLISLIGIVAGLVALYGMLMSKRMPAWTLIFLAFTLATSLTGFGFAFHGITPAFAVGVLSCAILAAAIAARYAFHLTGLWRPVYVVGAVMALYLNTFVLVVQSFLKLPSLHALAPNGSEPPFAIAQGLVLIAFIVAGFFAVKRFNPAG